MTLRPITRRGLLAGGIAAPAAFALTAASGHLAAAAPALRPAPQGSARRRCARCGVIGHQILSCPTAPTASELWWG